MTMASEARALPGLSHFCSGFLLPLQAKHHLKSGVILRSSQAVGLPEIPGLLSEKLSCQSPVQGWISVCAVPFRQRVSAFSAGLSHLCFLSQIFV